MNEIPGKNRAEPHRRLLRHTYQAAAVDVDPEALRFPGAPPMFGFRDPDGNRLYVVQRM